VPCGRALLPSACRAAEVPVPAARAVRGSVAWWGDLRKLSVLGPYAVSYASFTVAASAVVAATAVSVRQQVFR